MKKLTALLLALAMVLALAACGQGNGDKSKGGDDSKGGSDGKPATTLDIDMSKYPATIEEWTGQNFIDYFTEAGACRGGLGFESWIQDHVVYWPGTPVNELAGWWDQEGVTVMITIFSADNADTSQEDYDEWLTYIRENKSFTEEYSSLPVDHLVGNVGFTFEVSILDDDIYNAMSAAYENLVAALGVTPDF